MGISLDRIRMRAERSGKADLLATVGKSLFVVECKSDGTAALVALASRQAMACVASLRRKAIALVVVPFMGEIGRRLCAEQGVSWLDLSGNAHIEAEGLRIHVEGRPNRFKRRGRPSNLFAPKSARITRWMLIHPDQAFTQRKLAQSTVVDEGLVSRVVRGLETLELLRRESNGAIRVVHPTALLDAWREGYDFSRHQIVRGHVAARSSDQVLRQLAEACARQKIPYAATGLSGAWLLNQFTGFRLVTLYLNRIPNSEILQGMGFHEEDEGENVWLVAPDDEGVFDGVAEHEGICCAHPVQVYLDLKGHPERSAEAAERLRQRFIEKDQHV
jgi:hypothetical protein